ncbi:MAG: nitrite/sulfite reductase [Pseudonocardia sp.]|nr:nitrite/sulfite reductase [Pseudonocardia sp.]
MPTTVRSRPDACPGVLSPHDAADGALARIRLPGGVVTAAQLHAVADVADSLGDGALHLTSRGNLQLRGLDRDDPALVRRLAGAGLLPSPAHEKVRNVLASPAGGITGGTADVRGLAGALDRELCARPGLAGLPGRFLFALDDGRGDVAAERPDVCWIATGPEAGSLLVAGVDTGLACAPVDAPALLCEAAEAFLTVRTRAGDDARAWRAAEVPDAAARIRAAMPAGAPQHPDGAAGPHPPSHRTDASDPAISASSPGDASSPTTAGGDTHPSVGPLPRADGGTTVGLAPVLGELSTDDARLLADLAPSAVVTPWRTILLPDPHDPTAALGRLRAAGLVVDPGSPSLRVSACAGRPGCAKSLSDVRTHARAVIDAGPGVPVHVAGCERRCGAPHTPHADAVATGPEHYALDGTAIGAADLAATLHRPDPEEPRR